MVDPNDSLLRSEGANLIWIQLIYRSSTMVFKKSWPYLQIVSNIWDCARNSFSLARLRYGDLISHDAENGRTRIIDPLSYITRDGSINSPFAAKQTIRSAFKRYIRCDRRWAHAMSFLCPTRPSKCLLGRVNASIGSLEPFRAELFLWIDTRWHYLPRKLAWFTNSVGFGTLQPSIDGPNSTWVCNYCGQRFATYSRGATRNNCARTQRQRAPRRPWCTTGGLFGCYWIALWKSHAIWETERWVEREDNQGPLQESDYNTTGGSQKKTENFGLRCSPV